MSQPPPPSPSPQQQDPQEQEIDTAAAFLTLQGPCRSEGHIYLACVATAGLGQCRHLRAHFVDCAHFFRPQARERLEWMGKEQLKQQQQEGQDAGKSPCQDNPLVCASQQILRQYLPPAPPSTPPVATKDETKVS